MKLKKPFYGWIIVGVTFLIGKTESGAVQTFFPFYLFAVIFFMSGSICWFMQPPRPLSTDR